MPNRRTNASGISTTRWPRRRKRCAAAIVNERYDFLDKNRLKGDFLAYYRKQLPKQNPKWAYVYLHFKKFVHSKCTFEEIDVDLCNRFRDYLLNARQLKHPDRRVSRNSASGYWSTFRGFLNMVYRNNLLRTNVNDYLDKIEPVDVKKDFLSVDEVYKLVETPCDIPVLKTAALFSCLTSLRISDILALRWEDIVDYSAGGKCVHIITQKTQTEDIIPIGDEALELIGGSGTGLVFKGLRRSWTQSPMKRWIRSAGIDKDITFHCARHGFATLALCKGMPIESVSRVLGHTNIVTTQIYAKITTQKLDNDRRCSVTN